MKTRPCVTCGSTEPWSSLQCDACAATQDPATEKIVLLVSPTLAYRIVGWLRDTGALVALAVAIVVAVGIVGRIGNALFGEWFAAVPLLIALLLALCILIVPFLMLPDIWRNQDYGLVSNWRASRDLILTRNTAESLDEPAVFETTFHKASIDLHDVKRIAIEQSWLGRRLGYGDVLLYKAPGGAADVVFAGIANPAQIGRRIDQLAARAPALPKPAAGSDRKEPATAQPSGWLDTAMNALRSGAGAIVWIAIIGGLMYASWWAWSQHGFTMAPGESRDVRQEIGIVAFQKVEWGPQDTDALRMRIVAPPDVAVTFMSTSVRTSAMGAESDGTLLSIDYTIRIVISPSASPRDVEILVQFDHPKLKRPVAEPPVETFRVRIGSAV